MPSRKRPFKEDKLFFIKQVESGMTPRQLSDYWGCSIDVIRARKKEFGCFDYELHKNKCNDKSRKVKNENIFHTIDTEYKAYWLGFLYADGSVNSNDNRIELGLAEKDVDHIYKFKNFIEIDNKVSYRVKTKSYRYSFRNAKIKQDLIKQGCIPKKSLVLKFPTEEQVPNDLIHHFMRGYIDGDGFIINTEKTQGMGFLGTYDFISVAIETFNLKRNKITDMHHKNGAKMYQLYAKKEYLNFLNLLYKDANIYLDRKYKKYLSLLPSC